MTPTDHALVQLLRQEHAALVEDLRPLTEEQWRTPSLCAGWTIEDATAHLTAVLTGGWTRWARHMLRARLRPDVYNINRIREERRSTAEETLERFASVGTDPHRPLRPATRAPRPWLGELVVHAQDIRRPLGIGEENAPGIGHAPAEDALLAVAEFFASRDYTVRSRSLVKGIHLRATDAPFTHNAPHLPTVEGPLEALVMTMAGRPAALADLTGEGVTVIDGRLTKGA